MACPAATLMDGPPDTGPSAVCGVMVNDRERDWLASDPRSPGVLVTSVRDPSTFAHFCTNGYTGCPVWQAEKQRIWDERGRLRADLV